jgi:8-oxo-dGTP diphosphatase
MENHYPCHIVAATALISNEEAMILMVRHPRRGWELPGGKIEEGESIIDGLRREILEEAGVQVEIDTLTGIYSNILRNLVILPFVGRWVSGNLTTSAESIECVWVSRDEVLARITHPAIYDRTRDMLAFSGKIIHKAYRPDPYKVIQEVTFNG